MNQTLLSSEDKSLSSLEKKYKVSQIMLKAWRKRRKNARGGEKVGGSLQETKRYNVLGRSRITKSEGGSHI